MSIRSRKRFGGSSCAAAAVVAAMFCAAPAAASEPPGDQPAAAPHGGDGHGLSDVDLHIDFQPGVVDGGDVAGRIEIAGTHGGDDARPAAEGTAIPLPPPLVVGLIGLGISGIAARRRRRSGR